MFDREMMNTLYGMTEREPVAGAQIASSVVFKKEVVSVGFNRRKTHPLQKRFSKNDEAIFLHAEIDALIQARRELTLDELSKSTVYLSRRKYDKDRNPMWGLAKPCEGCERALKHFCIPKVVYSMDPRHYPEKYKVVMND